VADPETNGHTNGPGEEYITGLGTYLYQKCVGNNISGSADGTVTQSEYSQNGTSDRRMLLQFACIEVITSSMTFPLLTRKGRVTSS